MIKKVKPRSGQESVWDYPRPPRLERTSRHLRIVFGGVEIARTTDGYRVLETSHPPVYYLPQRDIKMEFFRAQEAKGSHCEWKGAARYWDLLLPSGKTSENVAWSYPNPVLRFEPIKGYLAFYAGRVDACYVDGERVTPQPGDFYGGWITSDVVGPFKGEPGSWGW